MLQIVLNIFEYIFWDKCLKNQTTVFFSVNMNYTLNRKYNKYSSLFDIYLTKWRKNEKYKIYIYQLNITITKKKEKKYLEILQ